MKTRLQMLRLVSVMAMLFLASTGWNNMASAQTTEPLLSQSNLVYVGAFRVPQMYPNPDYSYGGWGLGYYASTNSLYLVGNLQTNLTGEISIPTPVNSTSLSSLNTATSLQSLVDTTNGTLASIAPGSGTQNFIGGNLPYNGKLYIVAESTYDGAGSQALSQWVHSLTLSTAGSGPYKVGTQAQDWVGGYLGTIPSEWQSLFGGNPALVGGGCQSIASVTSNGPALSVYNPANLGSSTPATAILGYPLANPLGVWNAQFNATSNPYNGNVRIGGVVWPAGTSSILFFGSAGTGPFCYGQGTSTQSLSGTAVPGESGVVYCYDPSSNAKGDHSYPYTEYVWAYNANDLLKVFNGSEAMYTPRPYAMWSFSLPFDAGQQVPIGGAAYDPSTNRIYLSQLCTDNSPTECYPMIHVFTVSGGSSVMPAPTNLKIQ